MSKLKAFVGIDPGKYGCICILVEDGTIIFIDFHDDILEDLAQVHFRYEVKMCALEKQFIIPKQGAFVAARIMNGYGQLLGCLKTIGMPFKEIRPQEWQAKYELPKDRAKRKKECIEIAESLAPNAELKCKNKENTSGRADALLLALHVGAK